MSVFATLEELITLSGASYTTEQMSRAAELLPLVSDLIRVEGKKCGVDVDGKVSGSTTYANVVKLVVCDVVSRAMRQSTSGDSMVQESQTALGYTWSGTYAIPGGGVAMSLKNNDKTLLGFKRQKDGVIDIWDESQGEE